MVGHFYDVRGLVLFNNNEQFATASEDKTVIMWNLTTFQKMYCIAGVSASV